MLLQTAQTYSPFSLGFEILFNVFPNFIYVLPVI